jgi:hypothetical protein
MRTGLGSNLGPHGERPVTDCLSHLYYEELESIWQETEYHFDANKATNRAKTVPRWCVRTLSVSFLHAAFFV